MLVARAQLPLQSGFCAGGLQQCLLLCQVQTGGDSAIVTVLHQRRSLLHRCDRIVQNADLRIHLAQREEVGGGLRGQHQLHVFKVRTGGLVTRIGAFHAAPGAPEKVRLVTQLERQAPGVLRDGPVHHSSQRRAVCREPKPLERRRHASLRVEVADRHRSQRTHLLHSRTRGKQVLIRGQHRGFQAIQVGVVEDLPPCALRDLVLWIARPPRTFGVPCRRLRLGRRRRVIIRSDGMAPGQQDRRANEHYAARASHEGFPTITRTTCPFSNESGGFCTTRSFALTPCRISKLVPKSRPITMDRNCTRSPAPTTALLGPSDRNNMGLDGTDSRLPFTGTSKWTCAYAPGNRRPALFGTSTSVSSVRVFWSMALAVRTTVPPKRDAGNSASPIHARIPARMLGASASGTLTYTRNGSISARLNSSLPDPPLPAFTSAPMSTLRRVSTPAKGGSTCLNDSSSCSRRTFASAAAMFAWACA